MRPPRQTNSPGLAVPSLNRPVRDSLAGNILKPLCPCGCYVRELGAERGGLHADFGRARRTDPCG